MHSSLDLQLKPLFYDNKLCTVAEMPTVSCCCAGKIFVSYVLDKCQTKNICIQTRYKVRCLYNSTNLCAWPRSPTNPLWQNAHCGTSLISDTVITEAANCSLAGVYPGCLLPFISTQSLGCIHYTSGIGYHHWSGALSFPPLSLSLSLPNYPLRMFTQTPALYR